MSYQTLKRRDYQRLNWATFGEDVRSAPFTKRKGTDNIWRLTSLKCLLKRRGRGKSCVNEPALSETNQTDGPESINIHLTLSAADFLSQHIHVADTSTVLISAIVSGN